MLNKCSDVFRDNILYTQSMYPVEVLYGGFSHSVENRPSRNIMNMVDDNITSNIVNAVGCRYFTGKQVHKLYNDKIKAEVYLKLIRGFDD